MSTKKPFQLALICGGPSPERGISLNSARSVMDHLQSSEIEIVPLYVDSDKRFYQISSSQLYSNTPADFDFKLQDTATYLNEATLREVLKKVDLVFPVIHGPYGEDGELQALLESFEVPFVGSESACCQWMFRKQLAAETLRSNGYLTFPQLVLSHSQKEHHFSMIKRFFHDLSLKRAIVKPSVGGSSLGVSSVSSVEEAFVKVEELLRKGSDQYALLEPFCEGQEFTVVVFENAKGEPVALIPTEIELSYQQNQIFDFRKKYLPTNQVVYHTPSRFPKKIIDQIRLQAEQLFKLFGMRDFVRLDGWLTDQQYLYFTDINPISGLEQNSFFFRQSSILGLSHRKALEFVIKRACQRNHVPFPESDEQSQSSKFPVYVLFGNRNAERQVSLMSGTNVWLKLLQSQDLKPFPFFLDPHGDIWQLPYAYTLNHTVEEIYANCLTEENSILWQDEFNAIQKNLGVASQSIQKPQKFSLEQFFLKAKNQNAFVFIAMHGGEGENGTFQRHLETYQIPFNGSNSHASALCMDKYLTGEAIRLLNVPDLDSSPKIRFSLSELKHSSIRFPLQWQAWCRELDSHQLIIKPRYDGCSAGIVLLQSSADLECYFRFIEQKVAFIPPYSFANQNDPIEMPSTVSEEYLVEPYIETDIILIDKHTLQYTPKKGWIELTVGVLEEQGIYHAFNPSITIAEGAILSLEEKFQGGTGINLTPPPESILTLAATQKIKRLIEKAAAGLGIQNYARIDIFFNRLTEKMIVIEANTLPGLTPATVLYHQALAEKPALSPIKLLEKIITSKLRSHELQLFDTLQTKEMQSLNR